MVPRWLRLLTPLVATGTAAAALVTPAAAATTISPPTITAPLGGVGPYPVGTPVTFTFTETGVGTPVAYQYTLDGGPAQTVQAPSGTASIQITPVRRTGFLTAYAVAADGTVSAGTPDIFYAQAATPAADHDLNGDGRPDLLTVGGTAGLAPGLWQAVGAGGGRLAVPATDIGSNGNGVFGDNSPADFTGAQAITGHFTNDGFQDVLIYYPSGRDAGGAVILNGSGDGSVLQSQFNGNEQTLSAGTLTDFNGDNPLQLVNAYAAINGGEIPDLLATSGDPASGYYLDYYPANGGVGGYGNVLTVHTPSPDGTADWNKWTLATTSDAAGVGMFLWNESTGALYLWNGLKTTDNGDGTGTVSRTQYLISAHWHQGKPLATLEAADLNGDGVPDLWAVTPSGYARAYLISHLSTTSAAEIEPGEPQKLS